MEAYEYFVDRIKINEFHLRQEVQDQVELSAKVMRRTSELKWQAERQKVTVDEIEALTLLKIKEDLTRKRTVDEVKAAVCTDPSVTAAKRKLIDMKEEHDLWSALSESFRNRGYALRELVEIHGQERTSDPATIAEARLSR